MDRMPSEHIDNRDSITSFLDEDRAEVIEWIWGVEIQALLYFLEQVSEIQTIDVCVELESLEIVRIKGLRWLKVSFVMNTIIEHDFQMSLKGLHQIRDIGSSDISFWYCNSKSSLTNSIDSFPYLSSIFGISKDNIQKADNSSLLIVFLTLSIFVPFCLNHHAVLNVSPEQILEGAGHDLSLNDPLEPIQPSSLVHDSQVPHVEPSQMNHLLQLSRVGKVLFFVFDKFYQLIDFLVDQLSNSFHLHSFVLVSENCVVKGILLQKFRS